MQKSLLNVVESTNQGGQSDRRGRLVAVAGARGGVGATMLATGIAWTIANRRRRRVALVDLDLQFGNGGPRRWTWSPRPACARRSSIRAGSMRCSSIAP